MKFKAQEHMWAPTLGSHKWSFLFDTQFLVDNVVFLVFFASRAELRAHKECMNKTSFQLRSCDIGLV